MTHRAGLHTHEVGEGIVHVLLHGQQTPCPRNIELSGVRQADRAGGAVKELYAELLFDAVDILAEGRLCHIQLFRCFGKALTVSYRDHIGELLRIHANDLLPVYTSGVCVMTGSKSICPLPTSARAQRTRMGWPSV